MDTLTVLREARGIVERGWCKDALAVGGARCAVGALNEASAGSPFACMNHNDIDAWSAVDREAGGDIVGFNNARETTHADILALFDRAIAAEEAKLGARQTAIDEAKLQYAPATPRRRDAVGCETRERVPA